MPPYFMNIDTGMGIIEKIVFLVQLFCLGLKDAFSETYHPNFACKHGFVYTYPGYKKYNLVLNERSIYMNWLTVVSWLAIGVGILQALIITLDIVRYPQKMMPIMNIVWPLIGLYFPLFGILSYYSLGRANDMNHDMDHNHHEHENHHSHGDKPFWQSVFVSTTHCSGGCSLGDMFGAPIVFLLGLTIAGEVLFADYAVEFILAYLFGIAFQYYGMGFGHDNPGEALKDAVKADTFSLVCFEIGMFGWMALVHYVFFPANPPEANTAVYWFMMQLAMMLGFATSYPANWFLVKKGVKHAM